MANPSTILAHLQFVSAAAMAACDKIDNTPESRNGLQRQSLKELRKAIDSLRTDTLVYKVPLNAMENDTDLSRHSSYTRFIQQYVDGLLPCSCAHRANNLHYHRQDGKEVMESLERAPKATRRLLEESPAGNRHEVPINPSGNKEPKGALNFVLDILKAKSRPGRRQELIGDLKNVTYEIIVYQQNNECTFKLVWNLCVVARQWNDRHSVDNVGNIQVRVEQASAPFTSVLFAVSSEGDTRVDLFTFAILNHNRETASRRETFARPTGKTWVDDSVPNTMRRLATSVPCKPCCLSSYRAAQ